MTTQHTAPIRAFIHFQLRWKETLFIPLLKTTDSLANVSVAETETYRDTFVVLQKRCGVCEDSESVGAHTTVQ